MGGFGSESAERAISDAIRRPVIRALDDLGVDTGSGAPGSAADDLLARGATQLEDDAIGLHVAERIPIGALGLLDYAFCASASLRDGLERLARQYAVATGRDALVLVDEGAQAKLVFASAAGARPRRHEVELVLAIVVSRMRHAVAGGVPIDQARFAHAPPPRSGAHEAFFAGPVFFDAGEDAIVFARALLDRPLQTASPELVALVDHRMPDLVPASARSDTLLERVRRAVGELLDERECGLSPLAQRLRVRRRTLQRELRRRATSHTAILDDVRRERALVLLTQERTVAEVAELLGFSEAGAFFRAFRRWTGTSPKAFVAASRQGPDAPPRKSDVAPKGASFVA